MFKKYLFLILVSINLPHIHAQKIKTDANIIGHVVSNGIHIPFANVQLKGTTIGTSCDQTGHYHLVHVPPGTYTIVASAMGYKPQEHTVQTEAEKTVEIKFDLIPDLLNLEEVVVSADRNARKRNDASVIVNTISPSLFKNSQAMTLSEGLNFSPGLRMENNCQNCGFTQVRMNGLEGPYTQILINNRPIFSGLAGVYGLELIPSNMIERVEVVRGGGSALYGSNAIAGTVNIIMKDPIINSWEIDLNSALMGIDFQDGNKLAGDHSLAFNTSLVSDNQKTGLAVFGFTRERELFDANGDGFTELAPLSNTTMGSRFFHRFGSRSKLSVDFFNIMEEREGGNKHDLPLHQRDVAEAVKHALRAGALTWERYYRDYDLLSVFASAQYLNRDSYYGANQSLKDYGNSRDLTYNMGAQYKIVQSSSSLLLGVERTGGYLLDKKLGYLDYDNAVIIDGSIEYVPHVGNTIIANQSSFTSGFFTQYEIKLERLKVAVGARYDHYRIEDLQVDASLKEGNVFSPRLSFLYELSSSLQARLSYAQGYRAPQIFDEDLHIETSGSRQVINRNDPDLKLETSQSLSASLDFNTRIGSSSLGLLSEVFYTRLNDPFVNEIGVPDSEGVVIYTRVNAEDGATVKGINMEFKLMPSKGMSLTSGFTLQSSRYDKLQEFNERDFFRSPNAYGFFIWDQDLFDNLRISASGTYTGKMKVPYFGPDTDPEEGELRTSNPFFDLGLKISYDVYVNGSKLQVYGGVKNMFNSYQSDFDYGIDRDPAYMYGPTLPRMVYFGIKAGNLF
jgi:outer membrane receptor for ferrienterochelin and colicins